MFNKLTVMGRLTKDPEITYTPSAVPICNISIAMSEKRKNEEKTIFLDVTFFEKTAETVMEYFKKGDPILIDGKLSQDQWEKDGQKRSKFKMIANTFTFIPRTQDRDLPPQSAQSMPPIPEKDDNLPF